MVVLAVLLWVFFATYLILIVIGLRQEVRRWRECAGYQWTRPPISDQEFVRLCSPGTDPKIAIRVREIVSEQLAIPKEDIYPDSRFIEDLQAD